MYGGIVVRKWFRGSIQCSDMVFQVLQISLHALHWLCSNAQLLNCHNLHWVHYTIVAWFGFIDTEDSRLPLWVYHVVKQSFVDGVYNGFLPFLLPYYSLGILPPLYAHCIRYLVRILLLKLKYASIRHMVLIFYVRIPFTFFSVITFMNFSNPLVHILLCRRYGKGRLKSNYGKKVKGILT